VLQQAIFLNKVAHKIKKENKTTELDAML